MVGHQFMPRGVRFLDLLYFPLFLENLGNSIKQALLDSLESALKASDWQDRAHGADALIVLVLSRTSF